MTDDLLDSYCDKYKSRRIPSSVPRMSIECISLGFIDEFSVSASIIQSTRCSSHTYRWTYAENRQSTDISYDSLSDLSGNDDYDDDLYDAGECHFDADGAPRSQHKMQTASVAMQMIASTNISACKAAKICHNLCKDGILIMTPSQSAVYKTLFRWAAKIESIVTIISLGMTVLHFLRIRFFWHQMFMKQLFCLSSSLWTWILIIVC